ncbi:DUF2796 domain-containing protein [Alphaproteobacteria bacterium]|nr:DUF2796 domain-containing protein [Alphaproteobacteria bacterium]
MRYLIIIIFILFSFNSFSSGNHKHDHDHKEKKVMKKKHDHDKHDHDKKGSLDAHVHGLSVINVVQEKNKVLFDIEMPGFDTVGFEYKAKSQKDKDLVKNALNMLKNPVNLFSIPSAANCKILNNSSKILEEKNHTEFRAKYEYNCSNITEFSSITFNIFDSFKNSKDLELNVIGRKSTTKHKINKFTKKLSLYNFSN